MKLPTRLFPLAATLAATLAASLAFGVQAQQRAVPPAPAMTPEEVAIGKRIYFDRCAGCHGVLRKGATGGNLEPHWTRTQADGTVQQGGMLLLGTSRLERIIALGTDGGMVNYDDILTPQEINIVARYIQRTPDIPPEFSLADMRASWRLIVPPEQRPTRQMNNINLPNVFAVTLRDIGKLALIDGDTGRIWEILDTGFAVHISRMSRSGRYVYTVGRDGLVTMIDMWTPRPTTVATIKIGHDARALDTSLAPGFEDRYVIGGAFWPPQYSIMNGKTLEPLRIMSTRGMTVEGVFHPEPRVAAIVASQLRPEWIVNVKETGMVKLVDYSDIKNLSVTTIPTARYLHDGGFDASNRYFLVAANAMNQVVAVDTKTGTLAAIIDTKRIPHPGRGANFVHPQFGPVWATGHLGDPYVSLISTPSDRPEHARFKQYNWRVVQELRMPGAGNLFVKTHPNSHRLWADLPMNPERDLAEAVFVFDLRDLSKPPVRLNAARDSGLPPTTAIRRAVHFEYNKAGNEVWVSLWGGKADRSAIVVYDDRTLQVKRVITDPQMITPTGKFNVHNTLRGIY